MDVQQLRVAADDRGLRPVTPARRCSPFYGALGGKQSARSGSVGIWHVFGTAFAWRPENRILPALMVVVPAGIEPATFRV
jgi:hypothetical protein